ncbi:hypothetical protein [Flagellimonas nanhaiensis]|uniref:Uncharacterized protein n=1 Tax=Flagellimonas nanhaiensis TaxID=2292706 RepID=A0A371JSQ4_9FLAO|nr:hypothetical protein [Allomuricauda nanhaiensis]RDY60844.1 hypothetical protein DX873_01290 [Allomuricauda nanhaiensis]
MKNTRNTATLFLVSLSLMLGACQQGQKKESSEPESPKHQQERVAPPKGIITLEESKSLYDNYTRNRVDVIQQFEAEQNDDEKFEVARFTSFEYSEIKQYMAYIEQEAKGAGVDISSLRFYFANYPNKEKFPDGKKIVHPRQNSIFLVPTINVDGKDFGFYIGADGKAKLIKDAMDAKGMGQTSGEKTKSYASFVPTLSPSPAMQEGSLNLNRGNSSPPPPGDF